MRFRLEEVTFELPVELGEPVAQHYRDDAEHTLAVERGDDGEPAKVVAELRARLLQVMPDADLGEAEDAALAGRAGQRYSFALPAQAQAGAQLLVALDPERYGAGAILRVGWFGPGTRADADAAIDELIAAAVEATGREGSAPAGTRRWWMAGLSYLLPERYHCAPKLEHRGLGGRALLEVIVHPLDGPRVELEAEAEQGRDLRGGESELARELVPIIHGEWLRLRAGQDPNAAAEDQRVISRSVQRYEVGNPIQIRQLEVRLSGPGDLGQSLREIHERLLASVIVEGAR
ncbi:hypothetical protein G6O69_17850 [Pseudenhygromyxa sp. WMMC2535]|uniref:hypothetical protein n=1 Tax=Pseudenhygromyxa sp. WMMC2535 TaxID=2712867 RepID=UPI0015518294|nr:hypothetical protein [Pseudenhygromyxa sp. WMMC2535]NVB39712.1 hypothetical protein [Pseudenhygromyxa sp. WMMC2535]